MSKKVTKKVHGELMAARKAKREAKAVRDGMPPRKPQAVTDPPVPDASATPDDAGELVVFAFRLSRAERDLIHAAAGSAKASRFVRTLAVAAARGDGPAVLGILDSVTK